eukprot:4365242-Pleurochrysis_carterae.AAC.4
MRVASTRLRGPTREANRKELHANAARRGAGRSAPERSAHREMHAAWKLRPQPSAQCVSRGRCLCGAATPDSSVALSVPAVVGICASLVAAAIISSVLSASSASKQIGQGSSARTGTAGTRLSVSHSSVVAASPQVPSPVSMGSAVPCRPSRLLPPPPAELLPLPRIAERACRTARLAMISGSWFAGSVLPSAKIWSSSLRSRPCCTASGESRGRRSTLM